MGNQTSKRVGYCELKESIPGSFIAEQDFDLFYSLCKIESIRTISTLLHPAQSQLFYVVISGEVQIHLTSSNIKKQKFIVENLIDQEKSLKDKTENYLQEIQKLKESFNNNLNSFYL